MRRSYWLGALCLLAFALSWAYVVYYLRGGPRIIDATSYFLEARSLGQGSFSLPALEPEASFRGRFLLAGDGHALSVIFPPGYPALLALGVLAGAPMLVGPLLGAGLVLATYFLARALTPDTKVAWLAAALSVTSAALRYHSADTMSHGLSALLACSALALALRPQVRGALLGAGLCLGWLAATRPVDAAVALLLCAAALRRWSLRGWLQLALAALPGLLLLLLQQRAATGSWLGSTQLAYYAAADAPPGCFRYGFGSGVGCRFEHGDFVSQFLPNGYGVRAALRNLAVRGGLFAIDATNAVPLSLLAGYAAIRHLRSPFALLTAGVLAQALAYVPFYFDGNYPGGGARFLVPAIPLCQVLVARAAVDLRIERWAVPIALLGFLLHARHGHDKLREREGGRPMFEPAVVAQAGVTRGLVLVDTDHGFNLGHDPAVRSPTQGVLVARRRRDAHDRELYERLGRPPTYHYVYDVTGRSPPRLVPYEPAPSPRFEAEAEWPARLDRGSAYPVHFPCASAGAALRLFPGTLARLPAPASGVELGWVMTRPGPALLQVGWEGAPGDGVTKGVQLRAEGPGCTSWILPGPKPGSSSLLTARLSVELVAGEGALDYLATPQGERP